MNPNSPVGERTAGDENPASERERPTGVAPGAASGGARAADDQVRHALDTLLQEPGLRRSPQMSAFLRYVVLRTLAGESARIKAYTIGVDALGKTNDFDPQSDPSVRVLAKRLRDRLAEHYRRHPGASPRIEFRPGSYVPRFVSVPTPSDIGSPPSALEVRTTGPLVAAASLAATTAATTPAAGGLSGSAAAFGGRGGDRFLAPSDGRRTSDRPPSNRAAHGSAQLAIRGVAALRTTVHGPRSELGSAARERRVLHILTEVDDDPLAMRLGFVLGGMLARVAGVEVRRSGKLPSEPRTGDRIVSLHALRLSEGVRLDLQLIGALDGAIHSAEVMSLRPGENETPSAHDIDCLERWVAMLRDATLLTPPVCTAGAPTHTSGASIAAPTQNPFERRGDDDLRRRTPASGSAWLASAPIRQR